MARNKFDVDEVLETPFDIRHLKRSLVYAAKYKKRIALSLILSALGSVIGLLSPMIVQNAIDNYMIPVDQAAAVSPDDRVKYIILSGVAVFACIVVSVIFAKIRSVMMTKVGQDIVYDIRKDLFEHMQRLSFEYYDSRPHGKILTRIINYINAISDLMTNGLINFILEMINLVFITIFMFFVNWQLALVTMAGLPVYAFIMIMIKNGQRKAWQQVSNKSSNLNAYLHESIVGVKISQMFTREEENAEINDKLAKKYKKAWMRAVAFSNLVWPSTDVVSIIVRAFIFGVGLLGMGTGVVSFGTIIAMTDYSARFWQPLMNLSNLMNTFINAVANLERIFEMMDEPVTVDDIPGAAEMPEIKGDVHFRDVTFAYEPGINILEHLSFDVKAGQSIALVGPTGAGKTTFLNVLSNFIPKEERVITIEDSAELQIQNIANLVRLEARNRNVEGKNEVTIRDLVKSALRMRPDRIIVGEIRDSAAIDLLTAMNTGHDGSLSTGHANSPKDMLNRLETLFLMGLEIPLAAIRQQIASGIDIMIHLGRLRDKSRRVLEISEVGSVVDGKIELHPLFVFEEQGEMDGRVKGHLVRTKTVFSATGKAERAGVIL